ncbi:MAG: hypothetical protein ACI4DK_01100 [Lachnospiraceae bacterium]
MKKNLKLLQKVMCFTLVTVLFCGCGNAKSELVSEEIQAGETQSEEMLEETAENASEEAVAKETEKVEEESSKETDGEVQGETYQGMPVAQVDATVADYDEFLSYVYSLDKQIPALLIYNENKGYIINMGEGEYYQLKRDDRIFEYLSEREVAWTDTLKDSAKNASIMDKFFEIKPDYSKYDSPHKVIYKVFYTEDYQNGDYFIRICYLDAPIK